MSRASHSSSLHWWPAFGPWMDLALRSTATLMASGEVIARRSQRMATMGPRPSGADRREMQRMVEEKVSATGESLQAMGMQTMALMQSSALQWMNVAQAQTLSMIGLGRIPSQSSASRAALRAPVAMMEAGLKPFHRRATANASRLRRKRR